MRQAIIALVSCFRSLSPFAAHFGNRQVTGNTQLVKRFHRTALVRFLGTALLALTSGTFTACGTGASNRWIGDVTPRTPSATCVKTRAFLTMDKDAVTFAPDEGTWLLHGTAETNGTITAERIQQGANRQPFETRLQARRNDTGIQGTYTTPRCTSDVQLTRR